MYERFYHFSSKSIRKKEKYANTKWILSNLFFFWGGGGGGGGGLFSLI